MTYADERLALWHKLRQQAGGQPATAALRLGGEGLRFRLGTSLADLKIPMALDPAIETAAQVAARDLLYLLCLRHRVALRADEYDRLLLMDGFDPQRQRPVAFVPPSSVNRASVAQAFNEAPEIHPSLDSGTLAGWIGTGRPGRTLVGLIHSLLRRAVEEERSTDGAEPTPYLVLLALRLLLPERVQAELRTLAIAGPVGRILQGAVSAGMLVAMRLAARESGALESPSANRTTAALSVMPWLSGGRLLAGSGLQLHGFSLAEPLAKIDELVARLDNPAGLESATKEAGKWAKDGDMEQRAARMVAQAMIRRELLGYARMVESGRAPSAAFDGHTPAQLHGQPQVLERLLAAADKRKELAARMKEVSKSVPREADREAIEGLATLLKEYREEDPARCLSRGVAEKSFSAAAVALAVDMQLERGLLKAQAQIQARSGAEREGGIGEEYERGRLYRLAPDGPLLNKRAVTQQMGHLFCDVKDFTRRTAFLKEAVVADFLQREFYTPILTAAARQYQGASHLGDRGGIYLNNLLGDAVSFSGDVAALVELAHDIRRALSSYQRRLESEASSEVMARNIGLIEARYVERRKQQLTDRERQRLEDERESELALARGEKLEAGIFISYGAAPEVATFEDAIFGAIKVAIAEKINESARGTARNGAVRARVDSMVSQARAARNRDDLTCPLQVHIGQPLSIGVTSAEEADVRACLARGERRVAEGILLETVRRTLDQMKTESGGGDIYNGGAALSDEALTAYVQSRRKDLLFLRRDVPVVALHATLQERFVFPMQQLSLVAGVSHSTSGLEELFVFVGRALFRGFEKSGGLGIWELTSPGGPLFSLIGQHHVPEWMGEHQREVREAPAPVEDAGEWSAA